MAAGFLTTFTMLARDRLSLSEMSWILVKVFFGYAVKKTLSGPLLWLTMRGRSNVLGFVGGPS